jgi:hypothetical protein
MDNPHDFVLDMAWCTLETFLQGWS